jgi:hypothetical protein
LTAKSADDPGATLQEALASLTPVERMLWGRAVRRNLNNPDSRLSRMLPKYGLRAATQSVIGNVWLVLVLTSFLVLFPIEFATSGSIQRIASLFLSAVCLTCLSFAAFRAATSYFSFRKHRRAEAPPG